MKHTFPCFMLGTVILLFSLVQVPAQSESSKQAPQQKSDTIEVQVEPLQAVSLYKSVFYGTRLKPLDRNPQRVPIDGKVESLFVSAGEQVQAGQLLGSVRRNLSGRNYKSVEIRAEQSGIIAEYELRAGEPVRENQTFLTILDTSAFTGELWVSDKDIASVQPGNTAVVYNNSTPTEIQGRVASLPPEPDYESGLFRVKVEFRPQPGLFIGKFVRVELRKEPYNGLAVNHKHIQRKYGKDHLYIVNNGVVELREIRTGATYDGMVALTGGASAKEQYVISSERRISDGTSVKIVRNGNSKGKE